MQQPVDRPNIREGDLPQSPLSCPAHSIRRGRRTTHKGAGVLGKAIRVFDDRDQPVQPFVNQGGSNWDLICANKQAGGYRDWKSTRASSRTLELEHDHILRSPDKQSCRGAKRAALLPLPVNVLHGRGQSSVRPRYPPAISSQLAGCSRTGEQTRQRPTSPRKLLWPTEGPHMAKNLKRRQFTPCTLRHGLDNITNCSRHPPSRQPTNTKNGSPGGLHCSPLKHSKPRQTHKVRVGPADRPELLSLANEHYAVVTPSLQENFKTNLPRQNVELEKDDERPSPALLSNREAPQLPQSILQPPNESTATRQTSSPNRTSEFTAQLNTQPASHVTSPKNLCKKTRYLEARKLPQWQVWTCRVVFGSIILCTNIALLATYFLTHRHTYLLAILVFMKSKDLLSTIADILGLSYQVVHDRMYPPEKVGQRWILSLVSAYAETDDQIMKTINSLVDQELTPHKQVICMIVDGKMPDIIPHFTSITHTFRQAYTTWKGGSGEMVVHTGFLQSVPVIYIRKVKNAGKKDSLILGHDLFNHPRKNMPILTKHLRHLMFTVVLPDLTRGTGFKNFDSIFCTDADSIIHKDALKKLTDALARRSSAIAACGVLVAELAIPAVEWTTWHLYQQFQYTFGQYVRRQAEGIWGRVTCLPGCITMIAVRPEMGAAIAQYARPVTSANLLEHQVQYLGTDRRLTWCMLSQSSHLTSLLVSSALCETVVPENLEHYLSQRRRWASNAYFNDYYYAFGKQQRLITRLFAVIDIVRQSLVFYRVINTALFIRSLILNFYIIKLTPTLILTKTPAVWFLLLVLIREPVLRRRFHKLIMGMCINQIISPILSVIVFANVLLNMGSQGLSSADSRPVSTLYPVESLPPAIPPPATPSSSWSPKRLASIVRTAVRGLGSRQSTAQHGMILYNPQSDGSHKIDGHDNLPTTPGSRVVQVKERSGSTLRRRTPKKTLVVNQNG